MNKVMDMTKGNVFKLLIVFALPIFIGSLFQLLYNFTDSVISSHLIGPDALAAIGSTSNITSLIVSLACGMGAGASIVISIAFGEQNNSKIKKSIFNIIVINTIISLIISLVVLLLIDEILKAINVPANIYNMSRDYFFYIVLGLITTLMYNTLSGILRAFGNSSVPLYVLIFTCLLNVGGDFLFISGFNMGLAGSAIATILSQGISVVILLVYLFKRYPIYRIHKEDMKFDRKLTGNILFTGLSMGIMNSIYTIGGIFMSQAVNKLGSNIISANLVGRRLVEICMMPVNSFAMACAVFVSQNYGAKNVKRANEGILKTIFLCFCWSVVILIMYSFEKPLAILIAGTDESEVVDNALLCFNYSLPCFFPLGILLTLRQSLQSLERKIVPLISSSIELLFKLIAAFVWIPTMGYYGQVITEPISWIVCAVFLTVIYLFYSKINLFNKRLASKEEKELVK